MERKMCENRTRSCKKTQLRREGRERNAEMDGGPPTLDVLDELKEIHGKQVEDYQKYLEEYNK